MKKIIGLLIFIIVANTNNLQAQKTPAVDILGYLQSIVAKKANFIGQPFSVLKDSLKMQIKFFSPFAAIHYDKDKETSTDFGFYFPLSADQIYLTYPCLEVTWQIPLNFTQSDILWESNNGGGWSSAVAAFYANAIIKDIKVRE